MTHDNETDTNDPGPSPQWWQRSGLLLAGFLIVYAVSALVTQVISSTDASEEGSPVEAFTSGLLWILAMYGLVKVAESLTSTGRLWFWLLFTAAMGALAVDEIIGVHERVEPVTNDDWPKVFLWVLTPVVLWFIARIERAPLDSKIAMAAGWLLQTCYLLVELGDGEVFSLPGATGTLKNAEEAFELLFLAFYVYALWSMVLAQHARDGRQQTSQPIG
ncbi:MAG: hypothetical protein ACR2N2_00800 [Acidimicrobiia bacterium]